MVYQPLDKLINLHDGYRRWLKIDQLDVLMLQEAGEVFIIQSRCPHRGHPLEKGEVDGTTLYCPLHHFGFNLRTGVNNEQLCGNLKVWPPVFEGTDVGIMVER